MFHVFNNNNSKRVNILVAKAEAETSDTATMPGPII